MTAATDLAPQGSTVGSAQGKKLSCDAVVKYVRTDEEGLYYFRWRRCNDQGRWLAPAAHGDLSQLQAALTDSGREICLLLPGTMVVTKRMQFSAKERKHLQRLIPYELEDEVTAEIDDLHFAFGNVANDEVDVAYVDRELLLNLFAALGIAGIEIMHCLPEPLLLPRLENGWALRLGERLDVRHDAQRGFAVDSALAMPAITALCRQQPLPEHVLLIAADHAELQQLRDLFSAASNDQLFAEQIDVHMADEWDSLNLAQGVNLDLRQGEFARRLPFDKWAREWRGVAVMTLVALVAYVAVNIGQIQLYKSGQAKLLEQQVAVARQVIPQGQISDPQKQIEAQLARFDTPDGSSNVVQLLSLIAPVIDSAANVSLSQISYVDQSGTINLTLEADSVETIQKLRGALAEKRLQVKDPTMNQRGDKYRAGLVIEKDLL